jgi:thiol-disulfide isomerase/thioredoxin
MNRRRLAMMALLWGFLGAGAAAQAEDLQFRFDLESLGGRRITEQDFKAGVLLVDLWGTWCPPCRTAIPELVDLHRRYKHHGLEIVGLNY